VHILDRILSRGGVLEVDEAMALGLAVLALRHHRARDLAKVDEHQPQLLVVDQLTKVLDKHVRELLVGIAVRLGALRACHEAAHVHLLSRIESKLKILDTVGA